jgi:hypothetical protein
MDAKTPRSRAAHGEADSRPCCLYRAGQRAQVADCQDVQGRRGRDARGRSLSHCQAPRSRRAAHTIVRLFAFPRCSPEVRKLGSAYDTAERSRIAGLPYICADGRGDYAIALTANRVSAEAGTAYESSVARSGDARNGGCLTRSRLAVALAQVSSLLRLPRPGRGCGSPQLRSGRPVWSCRPAGGSLRHRAAAAA